MPFTLPQQAIAHADNLLEHHHSLYTVDLTLHLPLAPVYQSNTDS